ncbi:MAG: hypothetical protein WCP33_07755, partial [Deltaproteobacteria bacterium]
MKRNVSSFIIGLLIYVDIVISGCSDGSNSGITGASKSNTKAVYATVDTTTKAKVFLGAGDDNFIVSNSETTVYCNSGTDIVTISSGVNNVILDQNVEQINFSGASNSYTFKQTGNMINVYDSAGTTLIVKVPVQGGSNGTVLSFSNLAASAIMA